MRKLLAVPVRPTYLSQVGFVGLTLLALMAFAACGSATPDTSKPTANTTPNTNSAPATGGPSGIDPCSLVTKEQATQVLGAKIQMTPANLLPACIYSAPSSQILTRVGTSDDAKGFYNLSKAQTPETETIHGIGDEAYYLAHDANGAITVLLDKVVMSITIGGTTMKPDAKQKAIEQLAKDAVQSIKTALPNLSAPHPDPCSLVTKDEASKALNSSHVYELDGVNSTGVASCTIMNDQEHSIFVNVSSNSDATAARSAYDKMRAPKAENVKGIGDVAYSNGPGSVSVLKGNTFFGISVSSKSDSDSATSQKLAQSALGRI